MVHLWIADDPRARRGPVHCSSRANRRAGWLDAKRRGESDTKKEHAGALGGRRHARKALPGPRLPRARRRSAGDRRTHCDGALARAARRRQQLFPPRRSALARRGTRPGFGAPKTAARAAGRGRSSRFPVLGSIFRRRFGLLGGAQRCLDFHVAARAPLLGATPLGQQLQLQHRAPLHARRIGDQMPPSVDLTRIHICTVLLVQQYRDSLTPDGSNTRVLRDWGLVLHPMLHLGHGFRGFCIFARAFRPPWKFSSI